MEFHAADPTELPAIAAKIRRALPNARFFAVYGEMGAGKTTFITAFLRHLGVEGAVSSPTFSIVNEYVADDGVPVYHFDFYRIRSEEEVYDIGYEEYFFGEGWCFVEWPEKIGDLLPEDCTKVIIDTESDVRKIRVEE